MISSHIVEHVQHATDGLSRSNDASQAWHRAFSIIVAMKHPTRACLAGKLRLEWRKNNTILKYKLQKSEKQALEAVMTADFENHELRAYLHDIAHVLQIQIHVA